MSLIRRAAINMKTDRTDDKYKRILYETYAHPVERRQLNCIAKSNWSSNFENKAMFLGIRHTEYIIHGVTLGWILVCGLFIPSSHTTWITAESHITQTSSN